MNDIVIPEGDYIEIVKPICINPFGDCFINIKRGSRLRLSKDLKIGDKYAICVLASHKKYKKSMKRKIRRTGEIIDVITFSSSTTRSDHDRIQFYGDNGNVISESLNFYLDTLPVNDENKDVDWEQRRFDLIKAYSIEFVKAQNRKGEIDCGVYVPDVVSWSITIADRIIEAMRGVKNA